MNIVFNKLKNGAYILFDTNNTYIMSFLFGMLGALVIIFIFSFMQKPFPTIATVNITGIVDRFIKEESHKNLEPNLLKKEVKEFGNKVDFVLSHYSKQNNIIFFPSEAVIAGGKDYTPAIINDINHLDSGQMYEKN